jgi:hypothetical protein
MEDFVSFEIAKKLKEKGFTLPKSEIIGKFDSDGLFHSQLYINFTETMDLDEIIAPMISQVLKWLRDKKNIYCLPYFEQGIDMWLYAICRPAYGCEFPEFISESDYDTYEQAAIAGIEYVLNNLI